MNLDDKSSNDGDKHLLLSSDDDEACNHNALFPCVLEGELIIADDGDRISDDGGDLDAADDLINDPAFHAANPLADDEDNVQEGDADPEDEDLFNEPPAFEEHSAIRNAYVQAYVAAAFKGATHEVCHIILDGVACVLTSAQDAAPGLDFKGLNSMGRTLPTVEKCLSVNLSSIITYFFLCPVCWRVHDSSTLYNCYGHVKPEATNKFQLSMGVVLEGHN
ncbi:hypothetical protein BDR07DRAFT_1495607 [Suillus spraguei]|nr:hypothetical protein BDR07DRAFT_1495607 [Suillus spraguei]